MNDPKPTVIVRQYQNAANQIPTSNTYNGLRIHALPGLHEVIGALCIKNIKADSHVLDLAAGSGAMTARLRDLGFTPTAVDYVPENFQIKDIPFKQLDLNEKFSASFEAGKLFDGIVASEIIEHLENPFHFFRECSVLLNSNGKLILSTPNVQNAASIANFIRNGEFFWFSETDRLTQGHISPITQWQLRFAASAAGLHIDWEGSFGREHSKLLGSPRLKILAKLLDLITKTPKKLCGEIYLCVISKPS